MKAKKLATLLLVVVLVLSLFAACGDETTTTANTTASTTQSTTASATEGTTAAVESITNPLGLEEYPISLPLVDEVTTITEWSVAPTAATGMTSHAESSARQELAKRTNIQIEFTHPSIGQEAAQFNLMVASQEYCDVICGSSAWVIGGYDKYIDQDIIIDLLPYVDYMPNYMARRAVDEDTIRGTMTDKGRISNW